MGHAGALAALDEAHALAVDTLAAIDPALPELCRGRATVLIGSPVDAAAPETPLQRACVDLFDQIVLDVTGVTDRLVADVAGHLGPDGTATFVHAALAVEQRVRMHAMWQRLGLGVPS